MWQRLFVLLVLVSFLFTRHVHCQGDADAEREARRAATERFARDFIHPPSGRFPYMCSIRSSSNRSKHVCGGILINPRWVLTAAHCVDPSGASTAGALPFIYCGIYDVEEDDDEHVFFAADAILHNGWAGDVVNGYDLALLLLNRAASPPFPRLTTLIGRPQPGAFLGGLGWGATESGTRVTKLQYAYEMRVVSHRTCNDQWGGILSEDTMLCAGIGGSDACRGDSGGPLLQADSPDNDYESGKPEHDLIYGIISFGEDSCGNSGRTGVYTFVGYFQQWIIDTIAEETSPTPLSPTPTPPSPTLTPSPPEQTPIILEEVIVAIENDDAASVREALEEGLDPNSRYNDSSISDGNLDATLLQWAATYDSSKSVEVLLEFDTLVDARDRLNNTALSYAANFAAMSVLEILLTAGANVDAAGAGGFTPLHYASRSGHLEIVRRLITNGADVNIPDDDGETPLHLAAWRGHGDVVERLIDEGADVNAETDAGETPLHYAAKFGHLAVVEALLDAGASKRTRDNNGNRPISVVCSRADPECTRSTESAIEDLVSL